MKTVDSVDVFSTKSNKGQQQQSFPFIFWIISCISWILLVITSWISLKWLNDSSYYVVWSIYVERKFERYYYLPFQMHVAFLYIVFIFSFVFTLFACIYYIIKTMFKKDESITNAMLGPFTRFHFIPLLFISALYIIGESYDERISFDKHLKEITITGFIFSIIALISLIFIYIKTDLRNCKWWEVILLKKGPYSNLITLLWYYFCYNIYHVRRVSKPDDNYEDIWNWKRGCGLAFSIISGLGAIAFSFIFKDLLVCFLNILIYTGCLVYYVKIPKAIRKLKYLNKHGDLIVDSIMLLFLLINLIFLSIKYKLKCFQN